VLIDARRVDDGSELEFDLAVVGAGPAGISIVDRLRTAGLSIGLIEAGGIDPELRTQRLYSGENVGDPYFALDACRYRLFGGCSNRWGGWCRPLDPNDFEPRDWIPASGWPIRSTDLESFYGDTARLLELATPDFTVSHWSRRMPPPLPLSGRDFEHAIIQYSRPTNFAEHFGAGVLAAPNVTTMLHANVTELLLDEGGAQITSLRVHTLTRRSFTIRARAVVLAAGGIENARLLLASRGGSPVGVGNEHDLVGRYFMDHIHVASGQIAANVTAVPREFYRQAVHGGALVRGVLTPSQDALARRRLPSCSIALESWSHSVHGTPFLGWSPLLTTAPSVAYRRLHRSHPVVADRLKRSAERACTTALIAKAGPAELRARARYFLAHARGRRNVSLYFRAEQLPNPDSRVSLSDQRDELGIPLPRLDWRVGDIDRESITGWLTALDAALRSAGVGHVVPSADGWEAGIIGGPHHMGTTRMSRDPRLGVVDAHCRVHGVQNLYIAGSSVFTTSGYANPTFTIVALALRLAERLRGVLTA
jgi:choline dehydrogenase-like flavoprotein